MFEVTDSFHIRQFFKQLLVSELLQRAFKRGVCRVFSQYLPCGTHDQFLPCGTHNQRMPCGTHDQHMPCGTHERGQVQQLPSGTSKTCEASNSGTPLATQQTGAILFNDHREHVLSTISIFFDNLNNRGYGHSNTEIT